MKIIEKSNMRIIIDNNGVKRIYDNNGKLHNKLGPAVEYTNGNKEFWLFGRQTTKNVIDKNIEIERCKK